MSAERTAALQTAFGPENAPAFSALLDSIAKVAFEAYAFKVKASLPLHAELSTLSAKVPKFWLNALSNHSGTATLIDPVDRDALAFLEDVKIVHAEDVRDYTISFHFSAKNPFFKDTVLSKSFSVVPPSSSDIPAPSPYDLEADLFQTPTAIAWTSPDHNLTKKAPRVQPTDLEEYDEFQGPGSFFCLFAEEGPDEMGLGELFLEWWSHAIEYAAGLTVSDGMDSDSEEGFDSLDEEDDDDDAAEIDLESEDERPKKKTKK